jgi:serine protease Do
MSGLLPSRASWRVDLHLPYRACLVGVLLLTQALVPDLLAENQILKSVVRISATNLQTQKSQRGTGFVVPEGILTAAHVIQNADHIAVHTGDGDDSVSFDAELVFQDKLLDLALLKVKDDLGRPVNLPAATMDAAFPVQPGTEVYAIGNSLGFTRTVSKGIVSASGLRRGERFLLTDALIRKGNSGGPLVNHKGEVIAMVLGTMDTAPQGQLPDQDNSPEFAYTIPAQDILDFLNERNIVFKGYIGVVGKTVRVNSGTELTNEGLEVTKVITDCGLLTGDVIVAVGETQISTQRDLIRVIRRLSPGTKVEAYILRKGQFKAQQLTIGSRS